MKKLIYISFVAVLFFEKITAQTTTIDYLQSSLSTSACNVFNPSVSVNSVQHNSHAGGVTFGTTNGINLAMIPSGGSAGSTAFVLGYTFTFGYEYEITITAKGNSTISLKTSVVPNLNNFSTAGLSSCNVDGFVQGYSTVGYGQMNVTTSNVSADYNVAKFTMPSNTTYQNLIIWASGGSGSLDALSISKIIIKKTAIPELVLSPTSLATTCGSTVSPTFTVTNPNNVQNITSYEWNLGSSSNGWIYNGSAAPQNISTTSNSLSLTSSCGAVLQNVQVTVRVNSVNYKTYTCNVSSSNPTLSISGSTNFCSSESYSISNLPCNASVSWSASPSGIVSFSSTTSTNPTVTKITDGIVTLYATITNSNACNSATVNKELVVTVGTPKILYGSTGGEAFNLTGQNFNYGANGPGNSFSVCPSENLSFTPFVPSGYTPTIYAHSWTISGSYSTVGSLDQSSLDVTSAASPYNNFSFTYQYQNACGWSPLYYGTAATIDCANGEQPFRVKFEKGLAEADSSFITGISIYPNPVKDRLIINLDKRIAGIKIIRLVDATGRSISSQQIAGYTTTINFSGFANGIYYIEINQGKKRVIRKVIK